MKPADEPAKNAQLLIQAGYIDKQMAGVYSFLPLGKKVLDNVIQIIREEMNAIGGKELSLTALQPKEVWEATGRWNEEVMDVWFKTKLANGSELGLAPTHEEPLTAIMTRFINSYKDLPCYPYQFQIKFRNELRVKSGLLRCREFWMKDLYSFNKSEVEHRVFYEKISEAYNRIYDRLGIGDITYRTFASGGSFSKYSHEFQTISEVGEDSIFISEAKKVGINKEVMTPQILAEMGLNSADLVEKKAVEVGNIFTLGTKYSEPLGLNFTDENGVNRPVFMGSYGIGPSRLVGILAEHFADEKGLVWPMNISPYKVYLVQIGDNETINKAAEELYNYLNKNEISVFWDDRNERPGVKFADADLYGFPIRAVISEQTVAKKEIEVKNRSDNELKMMTKEALVKSLAQK